MESITNLAIHVSRKGFQNISSHMDVSGLFSEDAVLSAALSA
jgi:hypothetical protein